MKFVWLVFCLLSFQLFILKASAQSSLSEDINHLKQAYKGTSQTDTAYINKLIKILYGYIYDNPDSLFPFVRNCYYLSEQINYKPGMAEAYNLTGEAHHTARNFDSAIYYHEKGLAFSQKINDKKLQSKILNNMGAVYASKGNYPTAVSYYLDALKLAEANKDKVQISAEYLNLGSIYYYQQNYTDAIRSYLRALDLVKEIRDTVGICVTTQNLGSVYRLTKEYDKAKQYLNESLQWVRHLNYPEMFFLASIELAQTYADTDSLNKAIELFSAVIGSANAQKDDLSVSQAYLGKAKALLKSGQPKAALPFADSGLQKALRIGQNKQVKEGYYLLADIYEALGYFDRSLANFKQYKIYADSLNNIESERAVAVMEAEYAYSKKELQFQRKSLQQKWIIFSALAGMLSMGVIIFVINRNRRATNISNQTLRAKNAEIENQKLKLQEALTNLKETQNQLIQAEKMASLGEITAGIAHEIQNPLNFINNFSGVTKELLDETVEELKAGNTTVFDELIEDIKGNLDKIEHHGKRADGIVKSMLYHSRTTVGKKEPILINEICDEYLNLAYHGMRAKDKTFYSKIEKEFDVNAGKMEVIPQDLGRVLLNILNNAFFAVNERKATEGAIFLPVIALRTEKKVGYVKIIIEDNGKGIPDEIKSKIFQPFFTTKPTGSGTGLGLSISYDIITKLHNGFIDIESVPNEYTRFIISLPA
jgi:signal transduction histidine kinase